jgi:PmbA protein
MAEELTQEELLSIAAEACAAARRAGAEWADAAVTRSREIAVELEKSAVASAETISSTELSVRAVTDGARGMFLLQGVTRENAVAAGKAAGELSRQGTPDPDFVALPGPDPVETVGGLYDPALARLTVDEMAGIAVSNVRAAREVAPEVILAGSVEAHRAESAFVNSLGVTRVGLATRISAEMSVVIRRGDDVGSFYDFDVGRRLEDVALASLSAEAARWALRFLGARRVASKRMALVLGPLASFGFLRSLAASSNAESIQRQRSFLVGRLGQPIASPHLTLFDDGLIPAGLSSRGYDGEGAPRRRVTLVRQGVFAAMLHNSYTAHKAHEPNTGHGSQGGGIAPTNIQVELGSRTAEEIVADTEEGIYINAGGLSANPVSGDVSASVDFGFKIERGELAYPVTNTMVAGNVLEFLRHIDAVSRDCRREPGNHLPTLRIQDVEVAGSG